MSINKKINILANEKRRLWLKLKFTILIFQSIFVMQSPILLKRCKTAISRPLLIILYKSLHKEEQNKTSISIFQRTISVYFQTYEDTTFSFLVRVQQKMSPEKFLINRMATRWNNLLKRNCSFMIGELIQEYA